ncbi:MAG: N-acetylneuraminate synthase family protein [Caulobacterales bacterium]|nr:N-acetylneuraminate synthase family protein [Caulobacterales bacterium]
MTWATSLTIGDRTIAPDQPTYFIADIASSHDGDLERAKALIALAAEAGADCAKFQHFLAKDIVSDAGFRALGGRIAHQAAWSKPVYEVYEQHQTPREWTGELVAACAEAGVDYMTTPYDMAAVELMDAHVKAFKIGSGDISWPQIISAVAAKGKPVFLATGAADMADVERAVAAALAVNPALCLMQCNTNYTGSPANLASVNLNVLQTYARAWPGLTLGLSDHTLGHAAVLGAVALGARAVEKHFTDDRTREGPDHGFSMDPRSWREMVERTRELELALGDGVKRVEANERDSAVVQRRALRARRDLPAGHVLAAGDLEALRPCPAGAMEPYELAALLGRRLSRPLAAGEALMGDHMAAPRSVVETAG